MGFMSPKEPNDKESITLLGVAIGVVSASLHFRWGWDAFMLTAGPGAFLAFVERGRVTTTLFSIWLLVGVAGIFLGSWVR